jgi:hypothetical protein
MSAQSSAERAAEAALRALGLRCGVESRTTLAVLIPEPDERALESADVRERVLLTLRAHGFTHAAVELSDSPKPGVPTGDSPG